MEIKKLSHKNASIKGVCSSIVNDGGMKAGKKKKKIVPTNDRVNFKQRY